MRKIDAVVALVAPLALGLVISGCDDDNDTGTSPTQGPLTVSCSASPSSGFAPLVVSPGARFSPFVPTSVVVNYGDGTTSNNPDAAHTYPVPGAYTIAVSGTANGRTAGCQTNVTVLAPPPAPPNQAPILKARSNPNPPTGPAPLEVAFNLCQTVDPDGDRMIFKFNFGDGARSTPGICRDSHIYARGTYTATACVTDGFPDHESCQGFTVVAQ
jgi:hypothetical protein